MPPTFTYPGVYIEEIPSGVHTITGVATSIAAFVGWAPQGPIDQAVLVQSWSDFASQFGGLDARSYLGYAVSHFFANGGQQAYIVRLVWNGTLPAAPATNPVPAATAIVAGAGSAITQIQAAVGTIVSPPTTLFVGTAVLQSIAITPGTLPPIPINISVQFTATGTSSNNATTDMTASVHWSSSNNNVIKIAPGGLATPSGPGTATITATDPAGLISGVLTVTVSAASLSKITVTPSAPSIALGQTQQLAATGSYSDGTTQDLTAIATWTPSADFASPGPPGLFNGNASASVTATWGSVASTPVPVTVGAKALVSIVITPTNLTLTKTQTASTPFTATPIYSDGSTTPSISPAWSTSNPTVATLDGSEHAVANNVGSTTITATVGSISASTTVNVTAATLNSISVTPASSSIAKGIKEQLKALGIYSDGTTADLTGSATWTGGADTTVTGGLVTGTAVTASPDTITAAWESKTGSAQVTVTPAALVSIAISPLSAAKLSGQTQQFTSTGTLSDGTIQSPVPLATWTSSSQSVATVNNTGLAKAVAAGGSLTLFARNPGQWGNNLQISITSQPSDNTRFNLTVQKVNANGQAQVVETFVNLSLTATDPLYAVTVIDNDSSYVTFINPGTGSPVIPTAVPSPTANPIALSGGGDGSVLTPASDQNFEIALGPDPNATNNYGVHLLDRVDIFNLLCIPGETDAPTISNLQAYCFLKRAFYIVDPPELATTANLIQSGPVGSTAGSLTGQNSINSAYYYPWVQAPDPLFGNRPTLFPPCGFVAGIYASTDTARGVWKAPAGIDASLTGVNGLQYVLTDLENGSLNVQAINCLRQFKVYGDVVWGARTLQGNDQAGSEWKYVPIRRMALFLESSLYDGTQWVVFEPNDATLWGQIRLNVGAFMQDLFLKGAFQGTTPAQAYFVKCDADNNPQSSIDLGVVNILVGFAPLFPAEFVVIQIQQIAGPSQT